MKRESPGWLKRPAPSDSQLSLSVTSKVLGSLVSETLELDNGFCGCAVVRKTGFHIADCGDEVSIPLQHNLNRKTLDTGRRFIIHCVIVEHRSIGIRRGTGVRSKR